MARSQPANRSQALSESSSIVGNLTRCEDDIEDTDELSKIIERLDNMMSLSDPDRDISQSLDDSCSSRSNPEDSTSLDIVSDKDTPDSSSLGGDSRKITHIEKMIDTGDDVNNNSTLTMETSSPPKNEMKADILSAKDTERKKKGNAVTGVLKSIKSKSGIGKADTSKSVGKIKHDEFSTIKIDKLPQYFVVKYLGKRSCKGLWGVKHVRKPVDEMINSVMKQLSKSTKEVALPLSYLIVSPKGLDMREHPNNQVKSFSQLGVVPIDFISYGVQDVKHWRVFTYIFVQEMSSTSRKMECHAMICDSSISARKIALSLAAAFQVNMKKLKVEGKKHRFQVELRPPDELADNYQTVHDEEEC